jgi:hypothetical protein
MFSHAPLATWRHGARLLTLAAYEETGGVRGAITATAQEAYGGLSGGSVPYRRRVLLRPLGATRQAEHNPAASRHACRARVGGTNGRHWGIAHHRAYAA